MQHLDTVYKGEIIYIPVKLKPFIEPWLEQRSKGKGFQGRVLGSGGFQSNVNPSTHNGYAYGNKRVMFFCEDELLKAYKNMPVPHIPEKITEEAFVIEFTLEPPEAKAVTESSKPWQQTGAKKVERKQKGGEKLW
jgi:hypothetical protein